MLLSSQELIALYNKRAIFASEPIPAENFQPASVDLRLSDRLYRLKYSFLPGKSMSVSDILADSEAMLYTTSDDSFILEKNCIYLMPLQEQLNLPDMFCGICSPKSTTGRLDIFARVITEHAASFDEIPAGYSGKLYLEISPRAFSVVVRPNDCLTQLRLRYVQPYIYLDESQLRNTQTAMAVVRGASAFINNAIVISANMTNKVVGYKARKHAGIVDLRKSYQAKDFWEEVQASTDYIVLNPGDFYILQSLERLSIPATVSAEMLAIDTALGEFRAHYAGFFDPGFGVDESRLGASAVLEVRSYDVPFRFYHTQPVCTLKLEGMSEVPNKLYGVNSNYQGQSLKLAKQFV